ncbi:IPTL-CTERM sorting domain-containing protein [Delftia sp. DLF01]|uniref:Ig-like domain-containing protein n=1 Tax=Delftia sp. DLF01 TaxID=2769279 RepID=UPI00177F54FC|nr:Ig-like domain-containing protein [Delftia sp. DLF01]MBD9581861.1 IPTL-CTERM sorting domain-containing protein [Delftia sp. DLF01]
MHLIKRKLKVAAFLGAISWIPHSHAATFLTFVDNQPEFLKSIGSGTIATEEDFKTAVDLKPIGNSTAPDSWNGFTVTAYGPNRGNSWSPSKYCRSLDSGKGDQDTIKSCLWWNTATPSDSGIFAAVNIDNGISLKPVDVTTAAFSFDVVDWNDFSERSHLIITTSDGTSTVVSGPINKTHFSPQNFGVTLAPKDIAAGLYIKEILWIGKDISGEVVGFYNIRTYTNPVITNLPPIANPDSYTMVGDSLNLSLLTNDTDPDSDVLQVTSINGTPVNPGTSQSIPVSGGTVEVSASGVINFSFKSNESEATSITYEISDGRGGSSSSTVTISPKIEVNPVAPVKPIAPVDPTPPVDSLPVDPAPVNPTLPANPAAPVNPITLVDNNVTAVPTLSEWSLISLSSLLFLFGMSRSRRRS